MISFSLLIHLGSTGNYPSPRVTRTEHNKGCVWNRPRYSIPRDISSLLEYYQGDVRIGADKPIHSSAYQTLVWGHFPFRSSKISRRNHCDSTSKCFPAAEVQAFFQLYSKLLHSSDPDKLQYPCYSTQEWPESRTIRGLSQYAYALVSVSVLS